MATYIRTVDRNKWVPDHAKPRENARQRQLLLLSDVNEVFYGGAAGGGKTYATLIAAAQFVDVPGYSALLLRENFADLNQPGAWIPLSKEWWLGKGPTWNSGDHRWTFPSGATITFGYLERDDSVYQYDTASYQFCAIDELVQHTKWRYTFMFGRLRRPKVGPLAEIPVRMRSASNPGGKGHEWVKQRFIDPRTRQPGAVFVPALLKDNAGNLDTEAYRRDSLSKLDPLLRKQREDGDWDAVEGGRFRKEWFLHRYRHRGDYIVIKQPGDGGDGYEVNVWQCLRFGTCDPAASSKRSADYTVLGAWLVTPRHDLVWLDCDRFQEELPEQLPRLLAFTDKWKLSFMGIEAVGANSGLFTLASRTRLVVQRLNPLGEDKLIRATQALVLAESGRVWLPAPGVRAGFPLDDVESELLRFTGDDKVDDHDDVVDALSYAAKILANGPAPGENQVPAVLGGGR